MLKLLEKVFGSKKEKDVQNLWPIVDEIKEEYEKLQALTDEELQAKTDEFRARIKNQIEEDEAELAALKERLKEDLEGEERDSIHGQVAELEKFIYDTTQDVLNELLPEAFAVVKEACRRHVGKQWEAGGAILTWEMVPYDVQLIGGVVLHQGKIAEMATGEGKTLVATMPTYLNALPGKGLHIITVNDYLAKRDSEWMGPIYKFLGLTVGCIQSNMPPDRRKVQYSSDITFGTNNEFGFDYLRDNMTQHPDHMVQPGHNYAIIDEVDSILIDEARTPLIIAGPVEQPSDQSFMQMMPRVERLVQLQTREAAKRIAEAEELLQTGDPKDREQAGVNMLRVNRGFPKNKRLAKLLQDSTNKRLMEETELEYLRDKGARMQEIDQELYYAIDEKNHSIDITDKGRSELAGAGEDPDLFVLPDIATELSAMEGTGESAEDKQLKRDQIMLLYADRSDRIHTITQLLRAYSLYEKDVEYVVDQDKIKIVDEFTGRILDGRRYSDGLHQAIEAKEGVHIEKDTQTFATITIQNYFRLYSKLSGMTGTAETEEGEFNQIYKLDVVVIPTNQPIARDDMNDLILRTKRAKFNKVLEEIQVRREKGQPVLVGTTTVEVSETLSRMLQRAKVPHSVLNAKQHDREAEIVAKAGLKGAVTIATNMAGRGTDIKLGPGVKDLGGLHIIGTERHESRRIDRQLRGRAGRQGDPGSSQFFISLEDDLMRLFGGDKITSIMDRFGAAEDILEHSMLNKSVERAQKKVEENNFGIRKRLLEYDDVMNQQREVIYDRRRYALLGERMKGEIMHYVEDFADALIEGHYPGTIEALRNELRTKLLIDVDVTEDDAEVVGKEGIKQQTLENAKEFYKRKEEMLGTEYMANLERFAVLHVIDEKWRDHLREMDSMKEGIHLRAYGQRDPLVEYKKEAFEMFTQLVHTINTDVASFAFRYFPEARTGTRPPEERREARQRGRDQALPQENKGRSSSRQLRFSHASTTGMGLGANPDAQAVQASASAENEAAQGQHDAVTKTMVRDEPKIGRNDPCHCGSGKKYKHCHGR